MFNDDVDESPATLVVAKGEMVRRPGHFDEMEGHQEHGGRRSRVVQEHKYQADKQPDYDSDFTHCGSWEKGKLYWGLWKNKRYYKSNTERRVRSVVS